MKTHLHTLALHLAPTTIQPSAPNHHTHSAPNTLTLNTLNVYACCQKEQATTFNPLTLRMLPADITSPSHHYSKHRRHDWDQVRFCLQTARDTHDMIGTKCDFTCKLPETEPHRNRDSTTTPHCKTVPATSLAHNHLRVCPAFLAMQDNHITP